MKFKVTVELEEGTKVTKTGSLTSELILMSNKEDIVQNLISEAKNQAIEAMAEIINCVSEHGAFIKYEDDQGESAVHIIKDLNDIPKKVLDRKVK